MSPQTPLLSLVCGPSQLFNVKSWEGLGTRLAFADEERGGGLGTMVDQNSYSILSLSASMSVKDILQSLVDDALVDSDRIGTSNYFWAFPSKAINNVCNSPANQPPVT